MGTKPNWQRTNVPWELRVELWERMALGDNNTQVERWLDGQGGHFDRKTLGLVRLELQSLPDEYVGDLPATVHKYWRDLHNEAEQTSIPTYVRTATVAAHEVRLDGIAARISSRLDDLPPVPSALFRYDPMGGLVPWSAADAIKEITSPTIEFDALTSHFSATDFSSHLTDFFRAVECYQEAGTSDVGHIETMLKKILPVDMRGKSGTALFFLAVDQACFGSKKFPGTWLDAQDWLPHLDMMSPKAVHPRGGNLFMCNGKVEHGGNQIAQEAWGGQHIEVKVGPYNVGLVKSYEEAVNMVRELSEVAAVLPEERPVLALADMYFGLERQRDLVLEYLAPVAVEKWAADGHCGWCPSGAANGSTC